MSLIWDPTTTHSTIEERSVHQGCAVPALCGTSVVANRNFRPKREPTYYVDVVCGRSSFLNNDGLHFMGYLYRLIRVVANAGSEASMIDAAPSARSNTSDAARGAAGRARAAGGRWTSRRIGYATVKPHKANSCADASPSTTPGPRSTPS